MPSSLALSRVFTCTQCPKIFATRSNLKRHMENPNIHNIPYVRSRDQKRWKGHAKKIISREETTERMRKWRAENRDKNKRNDLRCRVYRLARQRFGEDDCPEKQAFVREEIARRLGRRSMTADLYESTTVPTTPEEDMQLHSMTDTSSTWVGLPFYNAPHHKIELPLLDMHLIRRNEHEWSPLPTSPLPLLSPSMRVSRRTSSSGSSVSSLCSFNSYHHESTRDSALLYASLSSTATASHSTIATPSLAPSTATPLQQGQVLLQPTPFRPAAEAMGEKNVKYVAHDKILDEFVGLVLDHA